LSDGQAAVEDEATLEVPAKRLDGEAQQRIERQIGESDLAVEAPVSRHDEKQHENRELARGLVELGRMNGDSGRAAETCSREDDRPRHRRRLAPAAAGRETAEAPEEMGEAGGGEEEIGELAEIHTAPRMPRESKQAASERAVPDVPAFPHGEQRRRRVAREHEPEAAAERSGERDLERDLRHPRRIEPQRVRAQPDHRHGSEKTDDEEDPV
jgi:hypothetical protein